MTQHVIDTLTNRVKIEYKATQDDILAWMRATHSSLSIGTVVGQASGDKNISWRGEIVGVLVRDPDNPNISTMWFDLELFNNFEEQTNPEVVDYTVRLRDKLIEIRDDTPGDPEHAEVYCIAAALIEYLDAEIADSESD